MIDNRRKFKKIYKDSVIEILRRVLKLYRRSVNWEIAVNKE